MEPTGTAPTPRPDASTNRSAARPVFVGRTAELTTVESFLRRIGSGLTSILLVEAEAGGGKTSLLRQALRSIGTPTAFSVHMSEGNPNDAQALRCLADALDCRVSSADPRRSQIAQLLRGGAADHLVEGMTAAAHELVIDVIERFALDRPVVLVIDDLHWVDDASLAALASLPRRLPGLGVGVLAATRPNTRVQAALRDTASETLHLGPFDDESIAVLAASATGERPSDEDLAAFSAVRSNPFLIALLASNRSEVNDAADAAPASGPTGGPTRAPVSQALGRMTAGLSTHLRSFLEVAAVAGRNVDVDLLAQVLDLRVAGAVKLAREAVDRGWMVTEDDGVLFRHDLYSEALVGGLSTEGRDRIHLLLGRTLAGMGHAPGRAAFHLDASSYLLETSDVSTLLRLLDALPIDDSIAASLARRSYELDRFNGEALGAYMKSLAVRREHAEVVRLAMPWLAEPETVDASRFTIRMLAATSCAHTQGNDEAIAMLQSGLDTSRLSSDQRADYLTMLARLQWYGRDAEAVRTSAGEALDISRQAKYVKGEVAALCVLSEAASMLGDPGEALRNAERAVTLSRQLRGRVPPTPELAYGTALVSAGRINEGLPVLARSLLAAERSGDSIAMNLAHMAIQSGRLNTGDWDGFMADADAMVEIGRETSIRSGIVFPLSFAALAACRRGQFERVPAIIARLRAEATMGDSHPTAALGSLVAELAELETAGRFDDACAKATWLVGVLAPAGFSVQAQVAMEAARLAWVTGDRETLQEMALLTRTAAERASTPTRMALASFCSALVDGGTGALISAAREMSGTERVWDAAVAFHMAGLAALQAGRPEATDLLAEAALRYTNLGCLRHAETARTGRGYVALHETSAGGDGSTLLPSGAGPSHDTPGSGHAFNSSSEVFKVDLLSGAERRVLELVAAGLANGDIASDLFVSKRTVESHVASLYRKLEVTTRVALARIGSEAAELRAAEQTAANAPLASQSRSAGSGEPGDLRTR